MQQSLIPAPNTKTASRGVRIIAKSVFKELKANGFSRSDVLTFANEMLSLMRHDLKEERRQLS